MPTTLSRLYEKWKEWSSISTALATGEVLARAIGLQNGRRAMDAVLIKATSARASMEPCSKCSMPVNNGEEWCIKVSAATKDNKHFQCYVHTRCYDSGRNELLQLTVPRIITEKKVVEKQK